jgi:hypothetical protein
VLDIRKETGSNLTVRRQTNAAAMTAERVGDGGDDADLTDAIFKTIAARGLAGTIFLSLE